jgi:hypothetical protein
MIVSPVVTAPPVMPPSRPAVLPAAGAAAQPRHPPPASPDVLSGGTTTAQPRQSARTSWSATEPANQAPEARLAAALQALSERVPAAGSPRYDPGHVAPPVYALDRGRMRPTRGEAAANVATGAMANDGVANGATATGATANAATAKDAMGSRPMVSEAMAGGIDATADVPSPGPAVARGSDPTAADTSTSAPTSAPSAVSTEIRRSTQASPIESEQASPIESEPAD